MAIVTNDYYLSLTQDNRVLRVRCSQGDSSRNINLILYNNGSVFTIPSGVSASVRGVRQNGSIFSKSCSIMSNRAGVVLALNSAITGVEGVAIAEIVLTDGSGNKVGTSNFIIQVESNLLLRGTVEVSEESPVEYISDLIDVVDALNARVNNIIAPDGEASLSEVVDARLSGYSGTTYQNLKARIDSDFAALNNAKADKSNTYTKAEVDAAIAGVEIVTDATLSITGAAADAKATGDAISALNESLNDEIDTRSIIGVPIEVRMAIYTLLSKAVYTETGLTDEIATILSWAFTSEISISAVYTQSRTIYTNTALSELKSDLVVTATYADGSTRILSSEKYTLSGMLVEGTSTITVSYLGKTTTFIVTATEIGGQRYLRENDIIEQVGFTNFAVDGTNGDLSFDSAESFSIFEINPGLLPIKAYLDLAQIIYRKNNDGTYYGFWAADNTKVFTKASNGTKYNVSDPSSEPSTITKNGFCRSNTCIISLENGVLTVAYENGDSWTVTNANTFGLVSSAATSAHLTNCEVNYSGNI